MSLSQNTLNLIPTNALGLMSNSLTSKAGIEAAELSAEQARGDRLAGKTEVATSEEGRSHATMENALETIKQGLAIAGGVASVAALAKTLSDGGQQAYDPQSLPSGTTGSPAEIDTMNTEMDQALPTSKEPVEFINEVVELQKAEQFAKVAASRQKFDATKQTLADVNDTIKKRASGELPNPQINFDRIEDAITAIIDALEEASSFSEEQIAALRTNLENSSNADISRFEEYVEDAVVVPYKDNLARIDIIAAQLGGIVAEEEVPIFDTIFGPPISYTGKYILSEDGIYYDSRSGGIPHITAKKITAASWELRYASNRGGKGQIYETDQLSRFANTILDSDYKNESGAVKDFYKYDDVIRAFEADKNLQIMDVSAKIADLITSGYTQESAIIKNYKESYAGVAYTYDRKIIKRKKQLQVAALFGPFGVTLSGDPQGEGLFYELIDAPRTEIIDEICGSTINPITLNYLSPPTRHHDEEDAPKRREFIERIPLNSFGYLRTVGLIPDLESQKSVMLHSSDLDDVVAPIAPLYLTQGPGSPYEVIPELALAPLGETDWVNTSGDTGGVDNVSGLSGIAYIRSLSDGIVTDNLIACYNFLDPFAVVSPNSNEFKVSNSAPGTGNALNAKMVGVSCEDVFTSGVTIPYLTGSLYKPGTKYGLRYSYLDTSSGSYVRLPNNFRDGVPYVGSDKLDTMMYNSSGWSMDFWAHTPGLSSTLTADHRYKLVAANENCGDSIVGVGTRNVSYRVTNAGLVAQDRVHRDGRTLGMIVGWRDRGVPNTPQASGLEFGVWPTVAQNDPKWGKSVCIAEDVSGDGMGNTCITELGFSVPIDTSTVSGYTIGEASGSFAHYAITCDVGGNAISLYVNGQFLASGVLNTLFGIEAGLPLNIPSRVTASCFQGGAYGEDLFSGELPGVPIFTPWILGGGFTDGIDHENIPIFNTTSPGFLGTNTNDTYSREALDSGGGPFGQHSIDPSGPGLGGYDKTGVNYKLARSGLDGHLGSFKMYQAPLTTGGVKINYNAQSPYFNGIKLPFRLI